MQVSMNNACRWFPRAAVYAAETRSDLVDAAYPGFPILDKANLAIVEEPLDCAAAELGIWVPVCHRGRTLSHLEIRGQVPRHGKDGTAGIDEALLCSNCAKLGSDEDNGDGARVALYPFFRRVSRRCTLSSFGSVDCSRITILSNTSTGTMLASCQG